MQLFAFPIRYLGLLFAAVAVDVALGWRWWIGHGCCGVFFVLDACPTVAFAYLLAALGNDEQCSERHHGQGDGQEQVEVEAHDPPEVKKGASWATVPAAGRHGHAGSAWRLDGDGLAEARIGLVHDVALGAHLEAPDQPVVDADPHPVPRTCFRPRRSVPVRPSPPYSAMQVQRARKTPPHELRNQLERLDVGQGGPR